jgi:hypothetical protein
MDRSRKENRERHEITLQYKSRQEAVLEEELIEVKLAQLLASVDQLKSTSEGAAELQRRIKLFGECNPDASETPAEIYAKLHHWLNRDMSIGKSPLHAPKKSDAGPTA